jgi:saccharopine dehydrogenase-like NADP-dependent oxidoreductase
MKNILVLGAGRSSSVLIHYLHKEAIKYNWKITVADASLQLALEKTADMTNANAISFDIFDEQQASKHFSEADLVISLLPPALHVHVAKACLKLQKHLITASYVSNEMQLLDEEAKKRDVVILNECGLDPGIDHMSAMQMMDEIRREGGVITCFKSYCGGLIAPESDDNPWGYKFTWNPRNVVLAGQGTVKYILNGKYKYLPYHKVFANTETVYIPGYGDFDGYANRDSLSYREVYGLQNIPTILRGTLRSAGYCSAWNIFVQLGMTDDTYILENSANMTYREFINAYLPFGNGKPVLENLAAYTGLHTASQELTKLEWLGIFEDEVIGLPTATPAQILQQLLEKKWKLQPDDKDMVVMQHQVSYQLAGCTHQRTSSMVVLGDNSVNTGMAKTVGLPLGIAAKLVLQGKISRRGVVIPVYPEIYEPVLAELAELGISFREEVLERS